MAYRPTAWLPKNLSPNTTAMQPGPGSVINPNSQQAFPEYQFEEGFDIPGATLPDENPSLKAIQGQQQKYADQFKANIPAYSDQLGTLYSQQAKQGLKQGIQDTRASFNRRGLLNSGKRISEEYGKQAATTNDINNYRSNLNQTLLNQSDQLGMAPYQQGLSNAGLSTNLSNGMLQNLASMLSTQNLQNQSTGQLIGGGLSGLGTLAGGLIRNRSGGGLSSPYVGGFDSDSYFQNLA